MVVSELVWNAAYDSGVEEIDRQHRFFLGLINRLSSELASCTDANYGQRLLD